MKKTVEMGSNRTGMQMSPIDGKAMLKDINDITPSSASNGEMLKNAEQDFIKNAENVGSIPLPGSVKGAAKTLLKKIKNHNPEILINKLGERLAYERSGVRVYECFLNKCEVALDANKQMKKLIPLDKLTEFCNEEAEHFQLLKDCLESLGADPTAQTPDANISGVAAAGLMSVISDPRTSISQCLEALLTLELTDHAAWELLIDLAENMGLDDMAENFQQPLKQEQEHLQQVRQWYTESLRPQAAAT